MRLWALILMLLGSSWSSGDLLGGRWDALGAIFMNFDGFGESFWSHFGSTFRVFSMFFLHMGFDIDFGVIFDGFWMVLGIV